MAIEHINEFDTLNAGREKINKHAIDPANRAEINSIDAKSVANQANQTSQSAKATAINTDDRLDNIIAGEMQDGEVIDARRPFGGEAYQTLGERLDESDAQLAEKPNLIGWELQNKFRKISSKFIFISDDGAKKDFENLLPISRAKGVPFVSAVVTNAIGNTTQMTVAQLLELQAEGWEISSHTHNHVYLDRVTYEEIEYEMKTSKETLENIGIPCTTLCVPYGFYDERMMEVARKYFRGARRSGGGINTTPLETYELRSLLYAEDASLDPATGYLRNSLEQYKYTVDKTIEQNGLTIWLMHSSNVDSTQLAHLSALIDYIHANGGEVVTLDQALNEYGNIVDIGNYSRDDNTKPHYVVGADGSFSTTRNNNKIQITKTDEYLSTKIPNDFPVGYIYRTKISTPKASGFPEGKAGTLITDRIIADGWAYQEYHVYGSPNIYKRYANGNTNWSTWEQINASLKTGAMQYYGTDAFLNNRIPTDFPIGCISSTTITRANASGFPENKAGRLFTDRLIDDTTWEYQTYHPILSNAIYKRYAASTTTWSAWTKVSVV